MSRYDLRIHPCSSFKFPRGARQECLHHIGDGTTRRCVRGLQADSSAPPGRLPRKGCLTWGTLSGGVVQRWPVTPILRTNCGLAADRPSAFAIGLLTRGG
jgi:hypothetical protein